MTAQTLDGTPAAIGAGPAGRVEAPGARGAVPRPDTVRIGDDPGSHIRRPGVHRVLARPGAAAGAPRPVPEDVRPDPRVTGPVDRARATGREAGR